jgi:hypothetical protein
MHDSKVEMGMWLCVKIFGRDVNEGSLSIGVTNEGSLSKSMNQSIPTSSEMFASMKLLNASLSEVVGLALKAVACS